MGAPRSSLCVVSPMCEDKSHRPGAGGGMASYFIHTHSTGSPWRRPGGLSNAITNKYHQPISTREREKRRNPARPRPPPQPTEPWLSKLSDNCRNCPVHLSSVGPTSRDRQLSGNCRTTLNCRDCRTTVSGTTLSETVSSQLSDCRAYCRTTVGVTLLSAVGPLSQVM